MASTRPSLDELKATVAHVKKNYKGTNPERLALIKLFEEIQESKENAAEALIGAFIFAMKKIAGPYWRSPKKGGNFFGFFPTGSDLYTLLDEQLNLEKNPIDELSEHTFSIYFYQCIKSHEAFNKFEAESKLHLEQITKAQQDAIKHVLAKPYRTELLKENLKFLKKNYYAEQKEGAHLQRDDFLKLIDFILQPENADLINTNAQEILCGLVANQMKIIESEYKLFSHKNDPLYQLCFRATNLDDLHDNSDDEKMKWYLAAAFFIARLMEQPKLKQLFPYLKNTLSQLICANAELIQGQVVKPTVTNYALSWAPTGANYGVSLVCGEVAQVMLGPYYIPARLIGLFATGLAWGVSKSYVVLTKAASGTVSTCQWAASFVYSPQAVVKKSYVTEDDWAHALMMLPDSLLSKADKGRLQCVMKSEQLTTPVEQQEKAFTP